MKFMYVSNVWKINNLKLKAMKKMLLFYFVYVTALGVFSGLLMSMGIDIMQSICVMILFWSLMLMPMLNVKD